MATHISRQCARIEIETAARCEADQNLDRFAGVEILVG
jgi:hypothetical protein